MDKGSIVGLKRPLNRSEKDVLLTMGFTRWPVKGESYEVELIREPYYSYPPGLGLDICIVLVEFPEFEIPKNGLGPVDMDAELFIELLPPLTEPLKIEEPVPEMAEV